MTRPRSPGQDGPGSLYKTRDWRKLRAYALRRAGHRCQWCGADIRGKGCARVDHIKTARSRPDLFFNPDNVRALCVSCDAKRHREKGGQGRSREKPLVGIDGFPVDAYGETWRI